ncbi:MAG TPA: hypothetical protein VLH81_01245 [Desulfobacterales bacterium]|nr:hypothetical protein [Desulfobacterales bacterium]
MRSMVVGGLAALLVAATLVPTEAQRWRGGGGMGRGAGWGAGIGAGQGAEMRRGGQGGWWNRVSPQNEEQRAFTARVCEIRNQIRTASIEIAQLRTQKNTEAQVQVREAEVSKLRQQLMTLTRNNARLMEQMGISFCPFGPGAGQPASGQGLRRGNGLRLRDGSGPNPNCPLK